MNEQPTTRPSRTARHSRWLALLGGLALVAGLLVPAAQAEAAKYPYKAPGEIHVANVGKDYAEVVFRTITGAPIYRVKAVGGGQTIYRQTGAEGSWIVTGLKPGTKYTFTVSVSMKVSGGYKQLSPESKAKATATTNPSSYLDSPTGLQVSSGGTTFNGVYLTWIAPAGFRPGIDQFRFDNAKDQRMSNTARRFDTWGTPAPVASLTPNQQFTCTLPVPAGTTSLPSTDQPAVDTQTVPEPAQAPAVQTPDVQTPDVQTPAVQPVTPASVPAESPSTTPASTPVSSPDPAATTAAPQASQVASPTQTAAALGGFVPTATGQVACQTFVQLAEANTNFYVRISVVDNQGKRISERSDYLLIKTRSPMGFVTGNLRAADGGQVDPALLEHYVVLAYRDGKDVNAQASLGAAGVTTLDATGRYTLELRAGTYFIQALYIGDDNWLSGWAPATPGAAIANNRNAPTARAGAVGVATGVTSTANDIRLGTGTTISGNVDCPGDTGNNRCAVDVAILSSWNAVVGQARSDAAGRFTVEGVPAGAYRVYIVHSEDRFAVKQVSADTTANPNVNLSPNADRHIDLEPRAWREKTPVKIKRSGGTLKVTSKPWLAADLPDERADNVSYQWYRASSSSKAGASAIGGANRSTYKLSGADKGRYVFVKATFRRYGFDTGSGNSNALRIG